MFSWTIVAISGVRLGTVDFWNDVIKSISILTSFGQSNRLWLETTERQSLFTFHRTSNNRLLPHQWISGRTSVTDRSAATVTVSLESGLASGNLQLEITKVTRQENIRYDSSDQFQTRQVNSRQDKYTEKHDKSIPDTTSQF